MTTRQTRLRALARAFASALWARARARPRRTTIQHRAATRPERAASGVSVGGEQPRRATPRAYPLARGHMHFSPERARAVRRAPARPEWSVASDAEGGSGERGGPSRTHLSSQPRRSVGYRHSWWAQKGRGRPGRPPAPQAPSEMRRAAWGAGCRATGEQALPS